MAQAAWAADDRPPLRTGAAYGAVLTRLGDVYSPVVNLASRLTSIARPGTVLVDRELANRLRGQEAYRTRPLHRVSVRGYEHLQPWLVRRRPGAEPAQIPDQPTDLGARNPTRRAPDRALDGALQRHGGGT